MTIGIKYVSEVCRIVSEEAELLSKLVILATQVPIFLGYLAKNTKFLVLEYGAPEDSELKEFSSALKHSLISILAIALFSSSVVLCCNLTN